MLLASSCCFACAAGDSFAHFVAVAIACCVVLLVFVVEVLPACHIFVVFFLCCRLVCVVGLLLFCLRHQQLLCSFSCSRHHLSHRFCLFLWQRFYRYVVFVVSFCLVGLPATQSFAHFLAAVVACYIGFSCFPCWVGRSVLEGSDDRRKVADAMVGIWKNAYMVFAYCPRASHSRTRSR